MAILQKRYIDMASCIKNIIIVAHVDLVQNIIFIPIGVLNITPFCLLRSAHHVTQDLRRLLRKSDYPKLLELVVMS